jgi:SPP1 gp7 family putative phage head morphogenesis protein
MVAFSSKELAQEQLEAIAEQPKKLKQAKPVQPDKQAARKYNAQLQKLVRAIKKDINEKIVPLIKSLEPQYIGDSKANIELLGSARLPVHDSWSDDIMALFANLKSKWSSPAFAGASKDVASIFVKAMNVQNRNRFAKAVKPIGVTGIDVFGDSPKLQDILSASIADNSRLITTIPEQYLNQVQSIVVSNMRSGLRPSAIVKQLSKQFGISQRRAALIARDQTSKANGELSKQRQEDTGFKFFKWKTSEDVRVRDDHDDISDEDIGFGKGVYKWDDPPKNEGGIPIIPGSEINCRCVAIPVTGRQVAENKVKD